MFKVGYSQYPIQQFIGADSAVVTSKGGMQGRFINVVFPDTTTANSQRIRQYAGAMIYAAGKLWVRNTTATGWNELAYNITPVNIYNSNGSLTSNRTLDGNGYSLTFDQIGGEFGVGADSINFAPASGKFRISTLNQGIGTKALRYNPVTKLITYSDTTSSVNIYNSDGTLTGNRELDGDGNNLTFTAVNKFEFSGDSLYYFLDPAGNLRIKLGNQQLTMQGDTASLSRRISYTGNLGSSFTKHSIVDKNYVDSVASVASGTVTSVATNNGTGITGGTITTTGTLAIDTALISTRAWRQKGIDSVTSLINARPSGSGTTNYIPKWTSSTALGNSQIFDNGTNVGIGITSPSARLHVQNGALTSTVTWNAADGVIISGTNFGGLQLQSPSGSGEGFIGFSSASVRNFGFIQYSNSTHRMSFATSTDGSSSGTTKMQITQSGRLLLGTTTESTYLLDVNGTARVREYLYMVRQDGAATIDALRYVTGGTIDIGTTFRVLGTNSWNNTTSSTSYIQNGYTTKNFVSTPSQNGSFSSFDFSNSGPFSPTIPNPYTQKLINGAMTINSTAATNSFHGISISATDNSSSIANNVFAVYADATLGTNTSATRWAGYFVGNGYFSGNVGIGTTSPSYKLDVNGTARFSGTELRLDNGTTGTLNIYSNTPSIQFFSADPTGYRFYRSGTGMFWNSAGSIATQISGNDAYTLDASVGHIWRTALSGGAATARLTTGGNLIVGGTTDAGYRADIQGTFRSNHNGYGIVLTSTTGNRLRWIDNGTFRWAIGSQTIQGGELANSFNFYSGTNSATQVSIAADGAVMIGVPFPISSNYAPSAILQAASTTRGFLPPRMTNAQMVAIASPAAGLVVYDTTNNKLNVYDGTNWVTLH
jgi:hypothetical protein